MIGTFNAGYKIIALIPTTPDGREAVVTGQNVQSPNCHVTWRLFYNEVGKLSGEFYGPCFSSGNYFDAQTGTDTRQAALADMCERAISAYVIPF
jgi:hypothetical protein